MPRTNPSAVLSTFPYPTPSKPTVADITAAIEYASLVCKTSQKHGLLSEVLVWSLRHAAETRCDPITALSFGLNEWVK